MSAEPLAVAPHRFLRPVPDIPDGARVVAADLLYGRLLATAVQQAMDGGTPPQAGVRHADGRLRPLPLAQWIGPVDAADAAVLARVQDPVLDIGCGPGRHLAALRAAGRQGLGVDLSPVAVWITRGRGADAMLGSVFEDVPGAGTWGSALLLDGNIGIGGAPGGLLCRARELLAPGGTVLVELDAPGASTYGTHVRLEAAGVVSEWFPWASVGVDGIGALADGAGLVAAERLCAAGRWFAILHRQ